MEFLEQYTSLTLTQVTEKSIIFVLRSSVRWLRQNGTHSNSIPNDTMIRVSSFVVLFHNIVFRFFLRNLCTQSCINGKKTLSRRSCIRVRYTLYFVRTGIQRSEFKFWVIRWKLFTSKEIVKRSLVVQLGVPSIIGMENSRRWKTKFSHLKLECFK